MLPRTSGFLERFATWRTRPISRLPYAKLQTALSVFLLAIPAAFTSGCLERGTLTAEPTGGSWKSIVLPSGVAIRLPPPPGEKSDQQRREIDELMEFQKQRTPEMEAAIRFWEAGAGIRWNELARELVAKHRAESAMASRTYALLAIAQYDALVAAWNNKYFHHRFAPKRVASGLKPMAAASLDPVYPSEHATVAAASAAVLTYLFPGEGAFLERKVKEHSLSRLWAGMNFRSDILAGDDLGRDVAALVIKRAQIDGADTVSVFDIPRGEGRWSSSSTAEPLYPLWGRVKPWMIETGAAYRAPPPPPLGSPTFKAELAEIRQISDARTAEQGRIAALWIDGVGSYTPPGRWNKIAADLILKYKLNEIRAARAFALLNLAMMDTGIACWETKYHYSRFPPSQADERITTPVGLPNLPSYPSAHAAFSAAGSEVLGLLFPKEREFLRARAEEAGIAGLYAGIHYRSDLSAGMAQGRAIAQLAIKKAQSDGSPR